MRPKIQPYGGTICKLYKCLVNQVKVVFNRTRWYKIIIGTVKQSYKNRMQIVFKPKKFFVHLRILYGKHVPNCVLCEIGLKALCCLSSISILQHSALSRDVTFAMLQNHGTGFQFIRPE